MKRLIRYLFIGLLFTASSQSFAAELQEDDKQLHMQASAGVSMMSYGAFRAAKFGKISSSVMSFTLAMAVGHIKESNDPFYDSEDMQANAVGAAAGILIPVSFTF